MGTCYGIPFADYLVVFPMLKIDCKTSETNEGHAKPVCYVPSTTITHLYLGWLVAIS